MCIGIEFRALLIVYRQTDRYSGVVIWIGCRMKWVNSIWLTNKTCVLSITVV